MKNTLPALLCLVALWGCAETTVTTDKDLIRICDDKGCSDRPRNIASFKPESDTDTDTETERRMAVLQTIAHKDPRAAYDLGLRYFRGDGVRRDSYQALQWMRDAAERGDLQAQKAVGRLYLSGLEEMGIDLQEAEKWLMIAAGRGDKESEALLTQAREKKKNEIEYQRWLELRRVELLSYWYRNWTYRAYWDRGVWVYY